MQKKSARNRTTKFTFAKGINGMNIYLDIYLFTQLPCKDSSTWSSSKHEEVYKQNNFDDNLYWKGFIYDN